MRRTPRPDTDPAGYARYRARNALVGAKAMQASAQTWRRKGNISRAKSFSRAARNYLEESMEWMRLATGHERWERKRRSTKVRQGR